jgi:hypothetical protein
MELWGLLDINNFIIRAHYIRSAAKEWADKLSRETDKDDWHHNPRIFTYLDSLWGPRFFERFATHVAVSL